MSNDGFEKHQALHWLAPLGGGKGLGHTHRLQVRSRAARPPRTRPSLGLLGVSVVEAPAVPVQEGRGIHVHMVQPRSLPQIPPAEDEVV